MNVLVWILAFGMRLDDGWHVFAAGATFDENGWRDYSSGRLGNFCGKFGSSKDASSWDISVLHSTSTLVGNDLLTDELYRSD